MNEAFGSNTTNERTFQRKFKRFRNKNDRIEDEMHGNRPLALDNDKLKVLVEADPRTTSRKLC